MTGHSTDIDALRKRAISGWKALGSPVPLLFDNARANATVPASFVRFAVRPSSEEFVGLGSPRTKREGRVWFHVAIPIGNPDSEAWALVDRVKSLFDRWHDSEVHLRCWEAETQILPDTTNYLVKVTIRYTSERRGDA